MSDLGKWCHVCATRHELGPKCPGEVLATSPERRGWKVNVIHEARRETYGVLIAEAGDLWRARVLTFPSMLWCIPGGRKPLKILGRTAQEVERHARYLIEKHCAARGFKFTEDVPEVEAGRVDPEAAPERGRSPRGAVDERLLQSIPVSFGEKKTDRVGNTSDISKGGMFVVTKNPLPKGRKVRIVLKLKSASIPLAGIVMWARLKPEGDRPGGMGIRLIAPPALYQHYVRELGGNVDTSDDAEPAVAAGIPAGHTGAVPVAAARAADVPGGAGQAGAGTGDVGGPDVAPSDADDELDFEFDFSAKEQ